jgi:hypothetical protein
MGNMGTYSESHRFYTTADGDRLALEAIPLAKLVQYVIERGGLVEVYFDEDGIIYDNEDSRLDLGMTPRLYRVTDELKRAT